MRFLRSSAIGAVVVAGAIAVAVAGASGTSPVAAARSHHYGSPHGINCAWAAGICTEVQSKLSRQIFGHYVGHDEPSVLFDSNTPGAGNRQSYNIILPKDPSASKPTAKGKSYQFELSGADWFGMAMCDTQSYPEQVSTCPPDSNKNILSAKKSPKHVGEAYLEMQFYPPGWIPWPTWQQAVGASSCSARQWCAALNIDSLSVNPVTNQLNNSSCLNTVGEEPVNFAFITKNGKATGPANPVDATTSGTYTPHKKSDLFMNPGDHLNLKMFDTKAGLKVEIKDLTTHQSGFMTASKSNGFAQVNFNPTGSSCTVTPYAFHPMYSTSSLKTNVTWAAGAYNVAMDTEIGHFQGCVGPVKIPATEFGNVGGVPTTCPSGDKEVETAGKGATNEPSDANVDDAYCFPGSEASRFHVSGCTYTNVGFDGYSYQPVWPDGNTKLHPTPFQFTSPKTGKKFTAQYKAAISVDLPAIESQSPYQVCDPLNGSGCTHIPTSDDSAPALFYPFYSTTHTSIGCVWQMGNKMPKSNDYGGNKQYGKLYGNYYTNPGGSATKLYEDFYGPFKTNPCPQK